MSALDDRDEQLRQAATRVLNRHHDPNRHTTGVALRTETGEVYTGISLKGNTGAADVHAEPIAVGRAIIDGASSFDTIVAVQFTADSLADSDAEGATHAGAVTRIVSPCGACRELLARQCPEVSVIVPDDPNPVVAPLSELLPY